MLFKIQSTEYDLAKETIDNIVARSTLMSSAATQTCHVALLGLTML